MQPRNKANSFSNYGTLTCAKHQYNTRINNATPNLKEFMIWQEKGERRKRKSRQSINQIKKNFKKTFLFEI